MNSQTLSEFQKILISELHQILIDLRDMFPNKGGIASALDRADITNMTNQRSMRHHKFRAVRDIIDALERMDAGVFGSCGECGKEIDLSILRATPNATLCYECQKKVESQTLQSPGPTIKLR